MTNAEHILIKDNINVIGIWIAQKGFGSHVSQKIGSPWLPSEGAQ